MSDERGSLPAARQLTMQDRLLVVAHMETLTMQDRALWPIRDSIIKSVRCCGEFPECSHVLAEAERIAADPEEPCEFCGDGPCPHGCFEEDE